MDYLFINIPVQESIDYIIHQIYTEKKLLQICSKAIFRRLLLKVTTECSFQVKQKLYKQTQGCSIGRPLLVTLADIHMIRTENDVVKPLKSFFYKRFVDGMYGRCKKNCTDQFYHELNNYHPNVNLTIEINSEMFRDTQFITKNGKIETAVYRESNKLPSLRSSNIPKQYKRKAINEDLHRSKQISTKFDKEIYQIKNKFLAADYPQQFVESVMRNFENDKVESV